jgi:hypothetical protein
VSSNTKKLSRKPSSSNTTFRKRVSLRGAIGEDVAALLYDFRPGTAANVPWEAHTARALGHLIAVLLAVDLDTDGAAEHIIALIGHCEPETIEVVRQLQGDIGNALRYALAGDPLAERAVAKMAAAASSEALGARVPPLDHIGARRIALVRAVGRYRKSKQPNSETLLRELNEIDPQLHVRSRFSARSSTYEHPARTIELLTPELREAPTDVLATVKLAWHLNLLGDRDRHHTQMSSAKDQRKADAAAQRKVRDMYASEIKRAKHS